MRRQDPEDAVFVELVEVDEHDAHGLPGDHGGAAPGEAVTAERHPRRRRALWWTGVGVLVLLVGAVAVANVLDARRDAARRAELAELGWVLPSLDAELEELWRAEAGWVMGETPGGILVGSPSQGERMRALSPTTGEVVWEIPVDNGYCWPVAPTQGMQALASSQSSEAHDLILCESMTVSLGSDVAPLAISSYDGVDGRQLATIVTEGAVVATALVDRDYLVASTLDDGTVVVALTDLLTGQQRWTYRSEPGRARLIFGASWNLTYDDQVVFIDAPADLALSRRTGAEVAAQAPPQPVESMPLPDGGSVVLDYATTTEEIGGRVVDADGTVRFEFTGWPWAPFGVGDLGKPADEAVFMVHQLDTSSPGSGVALVGLDVSTGTELWRRPDDGGTPLLALDGLGVMVAPAEATAFDLLTGEEVWTHPADSIVVFTTPVTDGEVILLADRVGGALQLVAVELSTGQDRWRIEAPQGLSTVSVSASDIILMSAGEELVAYRP